MLQSPMPADREIAEIAGAPVSITGVTKRYGAVEAVVGVTLEVGAGEFLSLLGPSGSGKSTILMMIAGFQMPSDGQILIGGADMTFVAANLRNIGMVFQRYALFPHMTVAQNIGFSLKMRRISRREIAERVEEALALVQLEGYGERMPAQLSGGQQQRVAVARAIVFNPPVLLMDEPLGALDKKLRQVMQLELKRLQQKLGLTVIYVTHDQEEALTMSDRIAVLNQGRLEQVGCPEELYEEPQNAFVADFIGETNFLSGEVVEIRGNFCLVRLCAGTVVEARVSGRLGVGTAVNVAVRPEKICLKRDEVGLRGVVTDHVYAGAMVTQVVRLADNHEVLVQLPGGNGVTPWTVGQAVSISWIAGDARAYPAADAI